MRPPDAGGMPGRRDRRGRRVAVLAVRKANPMMVLVTVVLFGMLVISIIWDQFRARAADRVEAEHHRRLLRELKRHD